jgi:ribosomal protein L40E
MAKKKLGNVELQWTCPNCGGINPGPVKTCTQCGSPQPEDVQFEQAPVQEIITDEEKIAEAEKGADIHCPYCGTRNPADATVCSQCGGDLTGGTKRVSGRVVGAYKTGPVEMVKCPTCGAENPATAKICQQCGAPMQLEETAPAQVSKTPAKSPPSRWLIIGGVIGFIALCALFYFLFFSTNQAEGRVQAVNWTRTIPIEVFAPVEYQAFRDQIPTNAAIISCEEKVHHTQDEPAENSVEVCGTPYTVDKGSGYAEVVQDCVYDVYMDYCKFSVVEWQVADTVSLKGDDYNPRWPNPELTRNQRLGDERTESYVIIFQTDDGIVRFSTSNEDLFQQAQIGSEWVLEINKLGGVVNIERK